MAAQKGSAGSDDRSRGTAAEIKAMAVVGKEERGRRRGWGVGGCGRGRHGGDVAVAVMQWELRPPRPRHTLVISKMQK